MMNLQDNTLELANKIKNASNNVDLNGYLENMNSKIKFLSKALDLFRDKITKNYSYMENFLKIKQHVINNNFSDEDKLYTLFYLCYFSSLIEAHETDIGKYMFNMHYSFALDLIMEEQEVQEENTPILNIENIQHIDVPEPLDLSEEEKALILTQHNKINNSNFTNYEFDISSSIEESLFIKVINHYVPKFEINLNFFPYIFKKKFASLSFYSTLLNNFKDITQDPNPELQDLHHDDFISYLNKFDLILIILYINYLETNNNFNEDNFITTSIQFLNNYINV